jgi:hypothetical protein
MRQATCKKRHIRHATNMFAAIGLQPCNIYDSLLCPLRHFLLRFSDPLTLLLSNAVRFPELTGTNTGSVDFFRSVIVAILTVLLLVDLVAGGLLLLRRYVTTLTRSGSPWLIISTASRRAPSVSGGACTRRSAVRPEKQPSLKMAAMALAALRTVIGTHMPASAHAPTCTHARN